MGFYETAESQGCKVEVWRTRRGWDAEVIAPKGFFFVSNGAHCIVAADQPSSRSALKFLRQDFELGMEKCEDAECDVCCED